MGHERITSEMGWWREYDRDFSRNRGQEPENSVPCMTKQIQVKNVEGLVFLIFWPIFPSEKGVI
jgi:hypothetical protein